MTILPRAGAFEARFSLTALEWNIDEKLDEA